MNRTARRVAVLGCAVATSAVLACSGGGGNGDSTPTPSPSPTATPPVRVELGTTAQPGAGWTVDVLDSSGSLVTSGTTDAAGVFETDLPSGGSIVVYGTNGVGWYRVSERFLGLVPGDVVRRPEIRPIPVPTTPPTYPANTLVDLTITGIAPEATSYTFATPCSSGGGVIGSFPQTFLAACFGETHFNVLAYVRSTADILSWGRELAVATSPGNTVPVTVAVNQTTFEERTARITNVPADATAASVSFYPYWDIYGLPGPSGYASTPSSTHERTQKAPAGLATRAFGDFDVSLPNGHWSEVKFRTNGTNLEVAWDAADIPRFSVDPLDLNTPTSPVVSYTRVSGDAGDVGASRIGWLTSGMFISHVTYYPPDAIPAEVTLDFERSTTAEPFFPTAGSSDFFGNVLHDDVEGVMGYRAWLSSGFWEAPQDELPEYRWMRSQASAP